MSEEQRGQICCLACIGYRACRFLFRFAFFSFFLFCPVYCVYVALWSSMIARQKRMLHVPHPTCCWPCGFPHSGGFLTNTLCFCLRGRPCACHLLLLSTRKINAENNVRKKKKTTKKKNKVGTAGKRGVEWPQSQPGRDGGDGHPGCRNCSFFSWFLKSLS